MRQKAVVIVVPIYHTKLVWYEKVSLTQLLRVLGYYPICFIMPVGLKEPCEIKKLDCAVERFPDEYFASTESYSQLCLSPALYERFVEYDYMLICQTDAFVFADRLMEFVNMGYDYIGAPGPHYWTKYRVVGNGGLSLRKISSVLRLLEHKDEITDDTPYRAYFEKGEDNFFSYCGKQDNISFSVAPIPVAARFAVQEDTACAIRGMKKRGLPFGVHAWQRMDYQIWKPIIEALGYDLPDESTVNYFDSMERDRLIRQERFVRHHYLNIVRKNASQMARDFSLSFDREYILWGAGYWGEKIWRLLSDMGITILAVFDGGITQPVDGEMKIIRPDIQMVKDTHAVVLVCSDKYDDEIVEELERNGIENCIRFVREHHEILYGLTDYLAGFMPEVNIEGMSYPIHFDVSKIIKIS